MSDDWPLHEDGRRKKVGEMTPTERRGVFKDACDGVKAFFQRPEVQAGIAAALDGDTKRPH